jgi:lysophospholipase L1-like esterase
MTLSAETQFLIDFNVHDVAAALGLPIPPEAAALMYGISLDELNTYQAEVDAALAVTAAQMAAQPETRHFIEKFTAGQTVLCIGDSITTYRYSYAHLLRHLLQGRGVQVINRGYSGYTSTHGLELTYTQFLAHQPDWVFIKYGVNDCKRFGGRSERTLVSLDEYANNLRNIIGAFQQHTTARMVVLTPTLVAEEVVNSNPDIMAMRLTWDNDDLVTRGEAALAVAQETDVMGVDLRGVLGSPPEATLLCPDGLHPNANGQRIIMGKVLNTLNAS